MEHGDGTHGINQSSSRGKSSQPFPFFSFANIPTFLVQDSKTWEKIRVKTTVDIPEKTLREAMKFAKATTKRAATLAALEEFNRKRHMAALVKHFGTFTTLMTNDEIEAMEMKRTERWTKRKSDRSK